MKKIFLITAFILIASSSQAQVYKFITSSFSVSERMGKGDWTKWSKPQDASIVISVDPKKNRIVIYSQEVQLYTIMNYEPPIENDNSIVNGFTCIGEDGQRFTISIITRKDQGNRKQLYLNQKDVMIVYNMRNYK